jgi:hypothetical protein
LGFEVLGFWGYGVLGFEFRVKSLGFRVQGLGLGLRVEGLGLRVPGFWSYNKGLEFGVWG